MKKTKFILLIMILIGVFLIVSKNNKQVQADSTQIISSTTINGDIDGDILISEPCDTAIKITGKVTLKNLNIICDAQVTTLIMVAQNSTLILDNVTITTNENVTNAILNQGKLDINNVQFPLLHTTYSIYNDSAENNAILLHNIGVNSLNLVYLNQGAIYVCNDTRFEDNAYINIQVTENYSDITDKMIGLAVVKSDKSFAGYFLDNFRLVGAPAESNIKVTQSEALEIFKNSYYLDYVGIIGDNFEDYETFTTYYVVINNTTTTYNINPVNSGDIIITKLNVWLQDSESEYQTDEKVYVAGKFATSRLFLKYTINTSYYFDGITLNTSILSHLLMDNCTTISGNKKYNGIISKNYNNSVLKGENDKTVNIHVVNEQGDEVETKSFVTSSPVDIGDYTYTSRWIEFISLNGETLDQNFVCPQGINAKILLTTQEFALIQFEIDSTANACSNFQFTIKASQPKYYDVNINNSQFTYSGQNYISDIVFSYTDENNSSVVITNEDCQILDESGHPITTLVNAGEYTLNIISTNPNIIFTNSSKTITISPKDIRVKYIYEYEYDGLQKSCEVQSILGLVDGDQINITFETSETLPGIYPQNITIDNANYKLDSTCDNVSLIINKKTIDLKDVKFASAEFEYEPNVVRSIFVTDIPEQYKDLVVVTYTNNNQTDVNLDENNIVKPYVISCQFGVIDDDLYSLVNAGTKTANLTIRRSVIDVYSFVFDSKTVVYDKNPHTIHVEGVIPEQIKDITYTTSKNGNIVENDIQTDAGEYNITATFYLKDNKNYEFKNRISARNCTLTIQKRHINQEYIDETIVFENDTVTFDNNEHCLTCYSLEPGVLSVSLITPSVSAVGVFDMDACVRLSDSSNYSWDYESFLIITRTLTITKGIANLDDVYLSDFSHVYDGREYSLSLQNAIDGAILSYEYYYLGDLVSCEKVSDAGEYRVKATLTLANHNCYQDDTRYYYATLLITQKDIDLSKLEVASSQFVYDGNPHNIIIKNVPSEISLEISQQDLIDSGVYDITVTPIYNERNYNVIGYKTFTATLTIFKANYDTSKLKFKDITKQYDGELIRAEVSGTLPDGLVIKYYENNEHIHVTNSSLGYEIASVYFDTTNPNYNIPSSMSCKIKITPIKVTIKLVQTQFAYTGNQINVQAIISNVDGVQVLDGDQVNVELTNNNNVNAGKYITSVLLDNSDYASTVSSLVYYINPIAVDMSDITFDDVVATYDGREHNPSFKGNLPNGIIPILVSSKMINAGTYTCYIEFKNSNSNYITPDKLTCTVTIEKKSILVNFSNYTNLVEDGTRKDIGVQFLGLIEDNFEDYQIVYSDNPIKSGVYTVTVLLDQNSNYSLINSNVLQFEILTNSKSYTDQDFEIKIKGEGFSSEANIQVNELNKNYVQDALVSMGVNSKDYDAFKLGVKGDSSKQEIDVSYKVNNRIINSKHIRIFRANNNNLQEINFEAVNNTLKFSANVDDNIVIVYEKDSIERNVVNIVILSVLTIISITSFMYLVVIFKKRRKVVNKFIVYK